MNQDELRTNFLLAEVLYRPPVALRSRSLISGTKRDPLGTDLTAGPPA